MEFKSPRASLERRMEKRSDIFYLHINIIVEDRL